MGGESACFKKVMLRSYKRPKGTGQLTEHFEHSGSFSDPSGAGSDLANEDKLIRGFNRGNSQGEVVSNGNPARQRGTDVGFSLTLGAESHRLPSSLLLLNEQM